MPPDHWPDGAGVVWPRRWGPHADEGPGGGWGERPPPVGAPGRSASCGQVDGRGADTRTQPTLSSGVKANADRHSANVLPIIHEIQRAGARSLRAIAEALTARGVLTARGGRWPAMTVSNVLARA
jgi:hypothetical protein